MNRVQFIIVTTLSGIVALCILLQIIFVRLSAADELKLRQVSAALQEGQADFDHLQQIATRVAQVAQQQNDDQLRQILSRQNIQVKGSTTTPPADATPTTTAPTTPSTH
jgi:hypothetical protein